MNAMHGYSLLRGHFTLKSVLLAADILLTIPAGSAHAEIWCLRDFGSDRQTCVFSSASQCTSAAVIGGGICERESLGRAAAVKPEMAKPNTVEPCAPRAANAGKKEFKGRRVARSAACEAS